VLFAIVELAVGADVVILDWEQTRCSWQRACSSQVTTGKGRGENML